MKTKYLFPHRFKKIGLFIMIPTAIIGLYTIFSDWTPELLDFELWNVFGRRRDSFFESGQNNFLNEILGILMIISSLMVAFSKERDEDEFISNIRLESLVWATYVNYGVLIIALILFYDDTFFWVMLFNMFIILIFFILRFHWKLRKTKMAL